MEDRGTTAEVQNLLQQGIAAARVGDTEEAREVLSQATELDSENEEAWLWLSSVVEDLEEKERCFQRVLEINPDNEQARMGLERVQEKLGHRHEPVAGDEALFCANHPDRETLLRCNRCGKPICPECAVRHPVGLRCKECAQVRRSPLYDVSFVEYGLAGVVGLVVSLVAAFVMLFIARFWLISFILGPVVGSGVAEAMSRVIRYKRGLGMQILAGGSIVAGVLILSFLVSGGLGLLVNPGLLIYLLLGVSAAVARLR